MTEREKLEFLESREDIVESLADSYCPPWESKAVCKAFKYCCVACWHSWLIDDNKGSAYVDTDSMKTDLPEDMY